MENSFRLLYKIENKYGYIGRSIYLSGIKLLPKSHWGRIREKESFPSDRLILFSIKIQTRMFKECMGVLEKARIRTTEAFDLLINTFAGIDLKKLGYAGIRGAEAGRGLRKAMLKMQTLAYGDTCLKENNFLHNPPGKKYKQFKSNKRISR